MATGGAADGITDVCCWLEVVVEVPAADLDLWGLVVTEVEVVVTERACAYGCWCGAEAPSVTVLS